MKHKSPLVPVQAKYLHPLGNSQKPSNEKPGFVPIDEALRTTPLTAPLWDIAAARVIGSKRFMRAARDHMSVMHLSYKMTGVKL